MRMSSTITLYIKFIKFIKYDICRDGGDSGYHEAKIRDKQSCHGHVAESGEGRPWGELPQTIV